MQIMTLAAWREQGMPADAVPSDRYHFDPREEVGVSLDPLPSRRPKAATDRFARLRDGYRADEERLPVDWERRAATWSHRDTPLGLAVSRGLFRTLGIEDARTLTEVLLALCDEPEAVTATMEAATALSEWAVARVLRDVTLDFALFNEPIASFHAPVVSPAHYRRFSLPGLRRLAEQLRAAGVTGLIVETYGQAELLIPLWLEAGLNTLWCYHAAAAGIEYLSLRRRYGQELRLIGGIPAAALLQSEAAIDDALARIVAPLLEQGGYLPMLDDRVRTHVPYKNYCYYRERLEQLFEKG